MNQGRYGHGVLRSPDPRFMALLEFCEQRPELLADPTVQLVKKTYEVAPAVLKEHGKVGQSSLRSRISFAHFLCRRKTRTRTSMLPLVRKRYAHCVNVQANKVTIGCVLYHYGLTEFKYYTVIFGVSRALGALTQIVWARGRRLT